jgi:hypothetical protein
MNGKVPSVLFKVIAVAGALAIGGTFVAWKNAEGEKAQQRQQAERAKVAEEAAAAETSLIVGSKSISMPVFSKRSVNSIIEIQDDVEAAPPKVLLPGSKVGVFKLLKQEEQAKREVPPKPLPAPNPESEESGESGESE